MKLFLIPLIQMSPYLVVMATGFIFSLIKYRDCLQPCVLTAIGTFVLFTSRIAQMFFSQWLPRMTSLHGMSSATLRQIYYVVGIGFDIMTILALACILVAVFLGRAKKPATNAGARALSS